MSRIKGEHVGFFEPTVNNQYLNSYLDYFALITRLLKKFPLNYVGDNLHRRIYKISVPPLVKSPFYVGCYGYENESETFIALRIFNRSKYQIKTGYVGVALKYNHQGKVVFGEYENGSNNTFNQKRFSQPICNISGILAPIEDAFSQSLAIQHHTNVLRVVYTDQPESSKFVQNYLNRGYSSYTTTDKRRIILQREFTY